MEGKWINRGDLWKDKARALQLRIRDRFRVTVDKHRRNIPRFSSSSDGTTINYSSNVHRWMVSFRGLRRESLSPSSVFYRKRVDKDVDALEDSKIMQMLQSVAVPMIGNVCHFFMHGLNHVQIYGAEKLQKAVLQRQQGKSLITVSNHVASVDDPFVISALLPPSVLFDAHGLRWTLCASDRCFKNPVTSAFFRSVKVLPVSRGEGLYQKGMDMAIKKLNNGGWVHIFPEGSRSRDGGKTIGSAKRGVGRLVMDADNTPIVVPFVHSGMQEIMPIGANFPRVGKTVTVIIGDPISFEDLLIKGNNQYASRGALYDAISSRISQRLHELKVQVDKLALEQSLQLQLNTPRNSERAAGILQQLDWEAFGMQSYIVGEDNPNCMTMTAQNQHGDILDQTQGQGASSSERKRNMDFFWEGGMMSRIREFMDTDLVGFAARGLFENVRTNVIRTRFMVEPQFCKYGVSNV
ncbi:hypothetical protein C5167_043364 [Papaver somniferum]|uniref:Tafazzin family protein n=1 Tax=Papaver somniferum TaxID=3469 RepID=A0A4Y7L6F8_PAPSO|nr:tafazzin-like [Papaver somniferum]RZC80776.1 hypothetical protein C5167_043364 [Papaver somniferum]